MRSETTGGCVIVAQNQEAAGGHAAGGGGDPRGAGRPAPGTPSRPASSSIVLFRTKPCSGGQPVGRQPVVVRRRGIASTRRRKNREEEQEAIDTESQEASTSLSRPAGSSWIQGVSRRWSLFLFFFSSLSCKPRTSSLSRQLLLCPSLHSLPPLLAVPRASTRTSLGRTRKSRRARGN